MNVRFWVTFLMLACVALSCSGNMRQSNFDRFDQLSDLDYSGFGECFIFMRGVPDTSGASVLVEYIDSSSCKSSLMYSYDSHGSALLSVDSIRFCGLPDWPVAETVEDLFERRITSLRILHDGSVYLSITSPGVYDMFKPSGHLRYDSIDLDRWMGGKNGWFYLK